MQLVAYGAQDVYLTGNPQITFWKVTYRRYTNFAIESIEQTFNGQADFGRRVQCVISRNGDLAYRTYLQVTLPEINQLMGLGNYTSGQNTGVYARWLDFPGEQLIAQVEVEIGGQRIDRQYGDWMHIWNQLTMTSEQQRGYFKMIGNTTQLTFITDPSFSDVESPCDSLAPRQVCAPRNALPETTLYVPLQFWFCTNPGLALPLIALQYHEVKINLDIRPIDECLWAVTTLNCNANPNWATGSQYPVGRPVPATIAYNQSLVAASLYVDYVFLDTDERRRMAQNPHEYLITQLQFTGDESVGSSSNKIKLNFNHPVKELIWVVQPDQNVDYCSSLTCDALLFKVLGAQPFNYTDAIDALPNAIHAFGGPTALADDSRAYIDAQGLFQDAGALDYGVTSGVLASNFTGYWHGPSNPYNEVKTCTAGAKTLSSPLSSNLTAKTASLSVKDLTSLGSNLTKPTPATLMKVLTFTHSLFALRNTNLPELATSPELIMLLFNSFSVTPPLRVPRLPRFVSMPLTTTSFVS